MGAGMLRKKLAQAGLQHISVTNKAINDLTDDVDLVITHQDLTDRACATAPSAEHLSLTNFLDNAFYQQVVKRLKAQDNGAQSQSAAPTAAAPATSQGDSPFDLAIDNIHVGLPSESKEEAIRRVGELLVQAGYAKPEYVPAMLDRENEVTTYLGNGVAIPHGTNEAKDAVIKTGIVVCQYPQGVDFKGDADDKAHLLIGIAAKSNEHMTVLSNLTNVLEDKIALARLANTKDPAYIRDRLMLAD